MTSLAAWSEAGGALSWTGLADWPSGIRRISSARARLGSRRMKPRSSSAEMSRWTPDLDLSASASFISSNEGETPLSARRAWM